MDKFTKIVKQKDNEESEEGVVYQNDYITVKEKNDWTYVVEKDMIVVMPYVKDEGYVYLRSENVPPWKEKYSGTDFGKVSQYLTVISGTIEDGEEPHQTLRRELYEESGIILSQFYNFNIEGPYFLSKGGSGAFYICLMELNYNDYKLVAAPGDGTKHEKEARTIKLSIAEFDNIKINDMVTKLLIDKLKKEYNL